MDSKDNHFQQEKGNENYQVVANMSPDWHFGGGGGSNFANPSMGSNPTVNPLESSSCSSAPMMDSFCPTVWDRPTNNLGLCDMNNANTLVGVRKGPLGGIQTSLDMGWIPPNSLVKEGMLLPPVSGMFPQSLSQFPADSGFIERAARFSCFGGGGFSGGMSPFSIPDSMSPYLNKGVGVMMQQQQQQAQEVYGLKYATTGGVSQKNEMNIAEASKGVSCSPDLGASNEGSPLKNDRKSESILQSPNEAKSGAGVDESDEAEFSGGGGRREEPSSSTALALKKRKRNSQDDEPDHDKETSQTPGETTKKKHEMQQKNDQNPPSATNKANEKQSKQGSASGSPKEDYIHIRARRGQATNSHSLAERIRREKISERMKFLQDLVPGCSKVTGKAVMLDEIINYVQSLQRQVEFLSMKLATVNPQLDFNIDGILAKEILQSRAGPSSKLGFPHDMTTPFPSLHPSQPGMIQTGLPGMSTTDALRRSINSQMMAISGGYKEGTSQVPNMWGEDELHNVIQMGFNAPPESQDLHGSLLQGQPKPEP